MAIIPCTALSLTRIAGLTIKLVGMSHSAAAIGLQTMERLFIEEMCKYGTLHDFN